MSTGDADETSLIGTVAGRAAIACCAELNGIVSCGVFNDRSEGTVLTDSVMMVCGVTASAAREVALGFTSVSP
jgi:hypothetical protein